MKFSDILVGKDILVSDDKFHASRKEECDSINSRTLVLQSQPITIKNQQSYILDLDMKSMGFGKIGVMTQNPLNIDVCQCTGLKMLKDIRNQDQKIMVTEFPIYDTCLRKFFESEFSAPKQEKMQIHLLLLLDVEGSVHYFINFEHRGTLFVGLELKYSWWLFFDLNGCLKILTATCFNGAPDQDLFEDEDGFNVYYSECARHSRLCYQSTLVILQLSESKDVINEILERSDESTIYSSNVRIKAKCDFRTGQMIPEGWANGQTLRDPISKGIQQGFIGELDTTFSRENTGIVMRNNQNASLNEKIELFEAEKFADLVVKKMKSKDEENVAKKTSKKDEKSFTDLSLQLPSCIESTDIPITMNVEIVPLVEGIIAVFLENSYKDDNTSNCDKCKEVKKEKGIIEKTYSTESLDRSTVNPNIEVEVELIQYRSIVQFQIVQCMGVRDPGVYLIIFDIDSYLLCFENKTQEDLVQKIEEVLWLIYQRGPAQVASQAVMIVMCYSKSTLDLLSGEKMVHNIQLLKKLVTESCTRHEYRTIIKGEPTIVGPPSTNRAEKIYEIKKNILTLTVNSPNVARLVPEKWFQIANILNNLSFQGTKIMSFGQTCQVLEDHCNSSIDSLIRTLEYFSNLGFVPWIGDKNLHLKKGSDSSKGSKIIEAQASVIITDKEWLRSMILQLQHDKIKNLQSSEKIDETLKSFSYHKLLFILILKFPSLAIENLSQKSLLTVFDYPFQPMNSSFSEFLRNSHDNQLTIYFILNQPFPWIYYISLLLASIKMSSNYSIQPHKNTSDICHFDLGENHVLDIYRLSETVIAASISYDISRKSNSNIIARVRQFVEKHIYQLSSTSSHRLTVRATVRCTCSSLCPNHQKPRCSQEYSCLHFLKLDEVLCNHVVFCGPRRIQTNFWRELFPPLIPIDTSYNSRNSILPLNFTKELDFKAEDHFSSWILKVSKILNIDDSNFNWKKLAVKLGYKDNIKIFEEERNPAMVLLVDWMESSGNHQLSMDFLILTLQEAGQYHISDIIEADSECQNTQPQVFLSYQWHNQPEAKSIVEYLNNVGFVTWMDVGQMGGGDLLMHRIERAIRCCKVLIACVTPQYIVSTFCHRELVLADLLKKTIIPVMISSVPWPPPGGTGLLLAPYVYIDIFGVGGHGGSGMKSDLASRYAEIEAQVSKHCIPNKTIKDLKRHSSLKIEIPQSTAQQPPVVFNGVSNNLQPEHSNTHQNSAFTTHPLPVPSQTSLRECSSICTII